MGRIPFFALFEPFTEINWINNDSFLKTFFLGIHKYTFSNVFPTFLVPLLALEVSFSAHV